MEAYNKYIENERKQRLKQSKNSSAQTQTTAHQRSHNNERQQNPPMSLNQKELARSKRPKEQEKSKNNSRPKELVQKATQTCIRHNQQQADSQSQLTDKTHTLRQHQPCQKAKKQEYHPAHRCPYRALRDVQAPAPSTRQERQPSPSRIQPKSLFNVDYESKSRRANRLPPLPTFEGAYEPDDDGAVGDCLIYKNSNFGKESSRERSYTSDILLSDPLDLEPTPRSTHHKRKDSFTMLESAREHCRETKARFSAKYATENTDSDVTGNSVNSAKSLKTVITAKSGDNLRTVVRSQIEMRELLHQSINKMTELTDRLVLNANSRMVLPSLGLSESDTNQPNDRKSQKTPKMVNKETSGEATNGRYCVSVEDIVSTKVIAPMMRRVQRMYLNNLQEEMKLMEDLERVPCQVSEVYKSAEVMPGPSAQLK